MFVLDARFGHVSALAFAPDAGALFVAHGYRGAHVWNLADRTSVPLTHGHSPVVALTVHPGGRWAFALVQPTPGLAYLPHVLDLPNGRARLFNLGVYEPGGVACSADGSRAVSVGHSNYDEDRPAVDACYRLYGWRVTEAGPEYEWHQDIPGGVGARAVAMIGNDLFATAEVSLRARAGVSTARVEQVAVRRARDAGAVAALAFPHTKLQQVLASPDGTKLVARCGTELRAWDATNFARPPAVVEGKYKSEMDPPAACFHPSGDYLLLANGASSAQLFETRTWRVIRKWNWKAGALRAVAVSPDGTLAAAGGPRGAVVVWDLDV